MLNFVGIQRKKWEEKMKKDALLEFGISDEVAEKIVSLVNDEFSGFVPKSRLDKVIEQRDKYKTDYDTSVEELGKLANSAKDIDTLKGEIAKLSETNKQLISDHEAKISKLALDNAVEMALVKADAKNTKAVKALMSDFLAEAKLEGDTVKGIDEAITKLKESDGYLFNNVSSNNNPTGHTPKSNGGSSPDKTPRSVFEARLAEAREKGNNTAAILIKQEASAQGISLL